MRTTLASILVSGLSLGLIACSSSSGSSSSSSSTSTASGGGGSGATGGSGGGASSGGSGGQGAAGPSWKQLGLDGSILFYLAVDSQQPSRIVVGTSPGGAGTGYYRSIDGGETWPQAPGLPTDQWAHGLGASRLEDILIVNPGVEGLLRSIDGGDTWSPTSVTLGAAADIEFHPTKPGLVWWSDGNQGVYRSTDGGVTWASTMNTGLPLGQEAIGALVSDGAKLYVAVGTQGVFVSSDDGDTFAPANTGLPTGEIQGVVNTLAANPTRPGLVLAQTTADGLFRTDDSGASWTAVDLGVEKSRYSGLAIHPEEPTTFYVGHDDLGEHPGGLLRSIDDGKTWSPIGPDGVDVLVIDFGPDDGSVYIGTDGRGVWRLQ
jgi:hypothetical protein